MKKLNELSIEGLKVILGEFTANMLDNSNKEDVVIKSKISIHEFLEIKQKRGYNYE